MKSRSKGKPQAFGRPLGDSPFGKTGPGSFGSFTPASGSNLSYLEAPPNLSDIQDANVAVPFKNLLKKDPTTKAKGLDDLVTYTRAHPYEADGGVEDAILDAWISVYPRAAIDNSRQVRELAHTLQLELMKSARKRMEKRIPKIVGTWLAASFDRDRLVARTANEGLASFLNTDEKQILLWKKCQQQILEYATDAYKETPKTLCDPRNTNEDDALAVYHRVAIGSIALVTRLLEILAPEELAKSRDGFVDFLETTQAVGSSLTSSDVLLRKTAHRLLLTAQEKDAELIVGHISHLRRCLITDGFKSDQQGSALEYIEVLAALIEQHPKMWSTKSSPLSNFAQFLKKGSQGTPASSSDKFWAQLNRLVGVMPLKNVTVEEANQVARALRAGLSQRNEFRGSTVPAWTTYLSIIQRLTQVLLADDDAEQRASAQVKFLLDNVFPLFKQYLHPSSDKQNWSTGIHVPILTRAFTLLCGLRISGLQAALEDELKKLYDGLITIMTASAPESSKNHAQSQDDVGEAGVRWFSLTESLHREPSNKASDIAQELIRRLDQQSVAVLQAAFDLLSSRNYKPYGAALVINAACTKAPRFLEIQGQSVTDRLIPSDPKSLDLLLASGSAPHLLPCLNAIALIPSLQDQYPPKLESVIQSALAHQNEPESVALVSKVIVAVLATPSATPVAHESLKLQRYLSNRLLEVTTKPVFDGWDLLSTVFTYSSVTDKAAHAITRGVVQALGDQGAANQSSLLKALEIILDNKPEMLTGDEELHLDLVTKLLGMMELSDASISGKASVIHSQLAGTAASDSAAPIAKILQSNLEKVGLNSLEVDTLVEQAIAASRAETATFEDLFPSTTMWMAQTLVFLQGGLDASLYLTNSIGGAYLLVDEEKPKRRPRVQRDRRGLSIPARMALFTVKMLSAGVDLKKLPLNFQAELIYLLHLSISIGADQLVTQDDAQLWGPVSHPNNMTIADEAISSIQEAINSIILDPASHADQGEGSLLSALLDLAMKQTRELTPTAVYSAKVLSDIFQTLVESQGFTSADNEIINKYDTLKATPSAVMGALGILTGYGQALASSKTVSTLCNRLVSDVAGAKADGPGTLVKLVLLNACMTIYQTGELPVANNRLVFAVKQITEWFENTPDLDPRVATESCRALRLLLPCIKDIYGPYWQRTIDFCIKLWHGSRGDAPSTRLPYIYQSLRLLIILEKMQDPNDDLVDVLQSSHKARSHGLLELLELPRSGDSQAEGIVDTHLCRNVGKIPLEHVEELGGLYSLIASESRELHNAAFGLLHRALPAAQQSLSVDVLLDKKTARLPDELLSLLLEAPTLESYSDDELSRYPNAIRSYLLSWLLVFDCYSTASSKVRDDYTEHLKTGAYTSPLLTFLFDVLGHSAGAPINLAKEGFGSDLITSYDIRLGEAEIEERDMHWLLIHLFYLTLKYTPGLFKSWYFDIRSKQTKMHVEAWTRASFSPLIVNEVLTEVSDWAASQDPPADDEKELLIKISRPGREVVASYEIDEESAAIAIKIPPSYPIDGVSVVGINRVAVSEKKWHSWLMVTQGVITFSNGSVVDGLATFRRNVIGALKGHTECAICYSIVSSDKRMPDKRCGTCRNMFHRTCMYKWFQTSGQNFCPLCRNPIDYLGATAGRRGER